jgi:hypothetical protein
MPNNITQKTLWLAAALLVVAGCSHRESQSSYRPAQTAVPTASDTAVPPASDRTSNRVYATQVSSEEFVPAYSAPNGVDASQWALAEQVRELLISDKKLAPYPSEVTVSLDKNTKGLVHVSGNIINTYEKRKLRARLEQLPGVIQVDDKTVVGLQNPGGGANLGK